WYYANATRNGDFNNTPTPQHPCTRSSSNSTTTLACEPNQFPKNPSARRSMIAPSQPKKASAFNEDGKDSNPTRHAGARHTFLPITPTLLTAVLHGPASRGSIAMTQLIYVLDQISGFVWGPFLLIPLLLGVGLYLTFRLGGVQFVKLIPALKLGILKRKD